MKILAVDLQHEFTTEGGALYQPRPCVPFLQETFLPVAEKRGAKIAEIISDYRATPPAAGASACVPGQWGYQSIIPAALKQQPVWVKAETSPSWIRSGGGQADAVPGLPYPAPQRFGEWLAAMLGPPTQTEPILVIGLMLEICVLCTLQELHWRGYQAKVLLEGVDTFTGDAEQKRQLCATLFPFWGQVLEWQELYAQAGAAR
jgi:nicotinamidase-related amidase